MKTDTQQKAAKIAIRAAKNRKHWGKAATRAYVKNQGVHSGLYRLACQLEAMEG